MNTNTIRFIHARRPLVAISSGHYYNRSANAHAKGGLTAAWMIDEHEALLVGRPAVCSPEDHYVRKTGSEIAADNLTTNKYMFVLTKGLVIEAAVAEYVEMLTDEEYFSATAIEKMAQAYRNILRDGRPSETLNSSFYEALIRNTLDQTYNSTKVKYVL